MAKNNAEPQMNPNFTAYIAPARNEARWWKVLLTLIVWFGVYALLGNILAVGFVRVFQVKELTQGEFTTPISMFALLLTFVVWIVVFWGALWLFHRRGLGSVIGGPRSTVLRDMLVAMVIFGVLSVAMNFVSPSEDDIVENIARGRWLILLPLALVLMFFQVSAEEIVFRGYIQQQLAVLFESRWVFMVLPSVLFGLAHFFNTDLGLEARLVVVAFTALLGLFMADLTYRTGNLGAAIGVHFVNNFGALLWLSYQKEMSGLARYYSPAFEGNPEALILAGKSSLIVMSVLFAIYFGIMEWWARR